MSPQKLIMSPQLQWVYLGYILGISRAYLGHISGISWAYLGHILGGLCGHYGKRSLEVTGLVISAIYRLLVMKDIRMRERTERVDKRKQTVQLVRRRRRMSLRCTTLISLAA